jgi:glucose-6-phosphate 1-dehydrogenase
MKLFKIDKEFVLIIFGASGDLAKLKLFPALYSLMEQNRFPKDFHIVGFSRTEKSDIQFRKEFEDSIKKNYKKNKVDPKKLKKLSKHLSYFTGQYDDKKDYLALKKHLKKLTGKPSTTKLAYFSVPPTVFKPIIQNLGETKNSPNEDIRLIIEKPFGQDHKSATELFHFVARYFEEEQVYLLDHYLGKTAVQSLLTLRHNNKILNTMMKGPSVANIQISAAESVGVVDRAGYFDKVGTLKDMVQSHLLQILALIAMSIPVSEEEESLHQEKYNILSALRFIPSRNNIAIGQYQGYKAEKDVPKNSSAETFAALRLFIDRESWFKTPIYIRTGKKLKAKHTHVVVELSKFAFQDKEDEPNRLIFELQPDEKIKIQILSKNINGHAEIKEISSEDTLACVGDDCLPEHGLLLLDVIRKKRLHFLSFQEIIATWKITDKMINYVKNKKIKPEKYKAGSEGPASQHRLTETDGFHWFDA